jgi:hypothetical protein
VAIFIDWLEGLRYLAIDTYRVDMVIFAFFYIASTPVYYFGEFLMIRSGYRYYSKKSRKKRNIDVISMITQKSFLTGLVINRAGWIMPYAYVAIMGRNIPIALYLLFVLWIFLTAYLFWKRSHRKIIQRASQS